MMKNIIYVLVGLLSYCSSSVWAIDDATSTRIKGVSQFLLDRANENYLYLLTNKIEKNDIFKCYFPNTYRYAAGGKQNFKLLLTSRDLWEVSVKRDLEALAVRQLYSVISAADVDDVELQISDRYIELMQQIKIEFEGEYYRLDFIPSGASDELKTEINKFYNKALEARNLIKEFSNEVIKQTDGCLSSGSNFESFKSSLDNLKSAVLLSKEQLKELDKNSSKLTIMPDMLREAEGLGKLLTPLLALGALPVDDNIEGSFNDSDSYVVKVLEVEEIIRASILQGVNPLGIDVESKEYRRFKRYIVSFAALADAETPESIKVVLEELTLPSVSFGLKREYGEHGVYISAYFGFATGAENRDSGSNRNYGGLFVPLGVEYNYGLKNGSLSFMAAPFDFAHPINLELENNTESVELKDIVRPGLYFSYGLKEYPLSIGIGASRGKSLRADADKKETQVALFLVMDMPLFTIF